jgi:hypothetical protein
MAGPAEQFSNSPYRQPEWQSGAREHVNGDSADHARKDGRPCAPIELANAVIDYLDRWPGGELRQP